MVIFNIIETFFSTTLKRMYSMQKTLVRSLLSGALLVSTLVVLTGCDFFKPASCPTCKPIDAAVTARPEDVLLTINGEPAIAKQQFEDFYEVASANAGPYGALSKQDAFNTLVTMEVLNRKIIKDGKDRDPAYKKDFARAYELARWGVNSQMLAKELQEKIDVSDESLEKFYNEQKGTNQAFARPPFIKSPESITIQSVQFADKPSAEGFLSKAKTDFTGAARTGNLAIKDHGKVTAQSQDIDFAIRLKARTLGPDTVELVQSGDKYFVIKSGRKAPAVYAEFAELKAMPQMKDMLAQFKKQVELEPAFLQAVEDYKKEFKLVENLAYFEEEEAQRKTEEDQLREIFAQKMKGQQEAKKAANAAPAQGAPAQGVVAA